MKKILFSVGSLFTLSLPILASAQTLGYMASLFSQGTTLLKNILIFLVSLAVVWFIWNVIRYTISEDEDKKAGAKSQMINGIIAITVIVSIWGLVSILQTMFGAGGKGVTNVFDSTKMIPGI